MGWLRRTTRWQPMRGRTRSGVRAAQRRRFERTATERDLVEAVSRILFEADPVGINFDTNTDEYDAEAETIVIGLPAAAGPDDVQALTHETFVRWFDAQTAGPADDYAAVAAEIWSLWQGRRGGERRLDDR